MKKLFLLALFLVAPLAHASITPSQYMIVTSGTVTTNASGERMYGLGRVTNGQTSTVVNVNGGTFASTTATSLALNLGAAPGAGTSYTATLMVNGATSSPVQSCTISGASQTYCVDLADTNQVAPTTSLFVAITPSNTPTAVTFSSSVKLSGAPFNASLMSSASSILTATTSENFMPYYDYAAAISLNNFSEATKSQLIPENGTLRGLSAVMGGASGAGATVQFAVMDNTATTSIICSGTNITSCSSDATQAVVAGDLVDVSTYPSGSLNTARTFSISTNYYPNVAGDYPLMEYGTANFSNNTVQYISVMGYGAPNTTESNMSSILGTTTVKTIVVALVGTPGTGKSYTFTFRDNGINTGLGCKISDSNSTCTATIPVSVNDSDIVSTQITPSGAPTAVRGYISYVATNLPVATCVGRNVCQIGGKVATKGGRGKPPHVPGWTNVSSQFTNVVGGTSPYTISYNNSNGNLLACEIGNDSDTDELTGITYGGTTMTQGGFKDITGNGVAVYLYYLIAPPSGINNIVVTSSGANLHKVLCGSFLGAAQISQPDAAAVSTLGTGTTITQAITTNSNNALVIGAFKDNNGTLTTANAGSQIVVKSNTPEGDVLLASSPFATTPKGSYTLSMNNSNGAAGTARIVMSFVIAP